MNVNLLINNFAKILMLAWRAHPFFIIFIVLCKLCLSIVQPVQLIITKEIVDGLTRVMNNKDNLNYVFICLALQVLLLSFSSLINYLLQSRVVV